MTTLRAAFVLLLTASAVMPYAAPALCTLVRPAATDPHMAAMHDGAQVTAEAPSGNSCDFAECATAPVAPVAALTVSSTVVPVTDVASPFPTVGPDVDPAPPLTPPPIA